MPKTKTSPKAERKLTHYEILGVTDAVTEGDLKRAYRKLALEFHPDRTGNDPVALERFKEVAEAYAVLSNQERRDAYDRELATGVSSSVSGGGEPVSGLGFTIFGPDFQDLVGRVESEGINATNIDSLIGDLMGVATAKKREFEGLKEEMKSKNYPEHLRQKVDQAVKEATRSPKSFLDTVEGVFDLIGGAKGKADPQAKRRR